MSVPDIQEAIELLERGKHASAISLLEQLVEAMPAYAAAHVILAQAYAMEEKWYQALGAWQRAQFLMPNSAAVSAGIDHAKGFFTEQDLDPTSQSAVDNVFQQTTSTVPGDRDDDERTPSSAPSSLGFDDLDRLIQELESAKFDPRPDLDDIQAPDLENNTEGMVSETLARIYAAQDQFEDAALVYEQLADQQPERSDEFLRKASEMRERTSG
jgi:tetratricopeptide (TPR) repeat protein